MKLTEQHDNEDTERVILVGLSGSGKSTLAAQLAEKFTLHWFDLENGKRTLRKLPREYQENINYIGLPDSASYPIASQSMLEVFKAGKGSVCIAHGKNNCAICKKDNAPVNDIDFSTLHPTKDVVVVDSITQLGYSVLAHLMKGKPVDAKPERDDWGGLRKFTEYFASQFQGAQFNLICIAHAVEAELEDGKKKLVPNFGSAGMSASIAAKFDHVIYCDVVNKKHKAFSSSTYSGGILTKSRTDFEIEKLPVPSLIPLFDKGDSDAANNAPKVITAADLQPGIKSGLSSMSAGQRSLSNLQGLKK